MDQRECRERLSQMPYSGMTPDDLHCIASLVNESDLVHDKRILSLSGRADGFVVVRTGEMLGELSGGGLHVIAQRNSECQWIITEVQIWAS